MDASEVLLEEYKAVQHESRESSGRVQSVAQYSLAAAGVGIGLGLVSASRNVTAGAIILMGLIPLLFFFCIAMMGLEIQRVLATRRHLRQLERRINAAVAPNGPAVLSWEALRTLPEFRVINPYPVVFAIAISGAALLGPAVGGVLLAHRGRWIGFAVGVALDALVLLAAVVACVRIYRKLRALDVDDPPSTPPSPLERAQLSRTAN